LLLHTRDKAAARVVAEVASSVGVTVHSPLAEESLPPPSHHRASQSRSSKNDARGDPDSKESSSSSSKSSRTSGDGRIAKTKVANHGDYHSHGDLLEQWDAGWIYDKELDTHVPLDMSVLDWDLPLASLSRSKEAKTATTTTTTTTTASVSSSLSNQTGRNSSSNDARVPTHKSKAKDPLKVHLKRNQSLPPPSPSSSSSSSSSSIWVKGEFDKKQIYTLCEKDANGSMTPIIENGLAQMRFIALNSNKIYRARVGKQIILDSPTTFNTEAKDTSTKATIAATGHHNHHHQPNHNHIANDKDDNNAIDLIRTFASNAIVCFADGSCIGNPGPAGSAAVICVPTTISFIDTKKDDNMDRMHLLATALVGDPNAGDWHEVSKSLGPVSRIVFIPILHFIDSATHL
jgi:hypothetical protein